MREHKIALSDDDLVFVFQRVGQRADQAEQAVAAGRETGAVLHIAIRPETLGGVVVALVEGRIEGFENKRLILLRGGLGHDRSPQPVGCRNQAIAG